MRSADSEDRPAPSGVYVHFPFCSIRCSYCDFPTVAGRDDRIERYLQALDREIRGSRPHLPRAADTLFLGGGTPSRLAPEQLARVLDAVRARFDLDAGAEITLEGNPESLTADRLRAYRDLGVTRISVGVQSLDDAVLKRVGRAHDAREAERAVRDARAAGFPDVSLDLIAGLPGEDLARWPETLRRCAAFGPDHVSVYLLETDKDTPLARSVRSGRTEVAGDDDQGEVYSATVEALEGEGLALYEISNFARGPHRSRHNLKYWSDAPYAGFGNGAHEYADGSRRSNRRDLDGYVEDVLAGRDPVDSRDPWDPLRRLQEALFLGLRVVEGVDLGRLARRYAVDPAVRWREAFARAHDAGLTVVDGSRVRLTPDGRLRSNELFAEFLS